MITLATGPASDRGRIDAQQVMTFEELCALFDARSKNPHVGKLTRAEYLAAKNGSTEQKKTADADKANDWFSLATYPEGERRTNANVIAVSAFGGDLDEPRTDGTRHTIETALAALAGLNCLIATTHSHHPEMSALRVIVQFSRPVSPAEHPRLFGHFQTRLGGALGTAAKDLARAWYWPSHCADTAAYVAHAAVTNKAPLDVDAVLAATLPPPPPDAEPREQWTTEPDWSIPAGETVLERVAGYAKRHPTFAAVLAGDFAEYARLSPGDAGPSESDFCAVKGLLIAHGGNCEAVLGYVQSPECSIELRGKRRDEERWLRLTIDNARKELLAAKYLEPTIAFAKPCALPPGATPIGAAPPLIAPTPPVMDEWPDPADITGGKLEAPTFDGSEFPPEVSEFPLLYARATGFNPSVALNAALTVMAAAIPDYIQVCADSDTSYFTQARLWHLSIAEPGSGKSPVQREMTKPLWKLHGELIERWNTKVAELDKDAPRPPQPRVIVADVTLEKLSDVLSENPRGIILATDEFSAWLGSLDQYKNGGAQGRDRGEWLRLFDGGPHQIERVTRGSKFIPNWGASILTASTPAQIGKYAKNLPEDGLIQRFLIAIGRRKQAVAVRPGTGDLDAARGRYVETVTRLWNLSPGLSRGIVHLSPEARARFDAWNTANDELVSAFAEIEPAFASHLAKYSAFALRIALTFHCARTVRAVQSGAPDPGASTLAVDSLELAFAYLRRAALHARAMFGRGSSPAMDLARDIARLILAKPTQTALQRRDILRHVQSFATADEPVQAMALRILADFGWVRESDDGYRKRHATRFDVNPKVAAKFAALAEKEQARRALVREAIAQSAEGRREQMS